MNIYVLEIRVNNYGVNPYIKKRIIYLLHGDPGEIVPNKNKAQQSLPLLLFLYGTVFSSSIS